MPKVTKYPRLRSHVRKNKDGKVRVYYFYDMRPDGKQDIPLGTDHLEAIRQWDELHNKTPKARGRVQEAISRWRDIELPKYNSQETRKGYEKQILRIEGVFGKMAWDEVTLPMLREYLDRRAAKVQGNREMSVFSIVWSKARLWGMTSKPWPAAGMKNWKNEERPRQAEVEDSIFNAIYSHANQMLRDAMDIATATGMRLTDVRTVRLPSGDLLRLKANKTGKAADFDISMSQVLPGLIERRRSLRADHIMLLSTPTGRPVSARMLRTAYDDARAAAVKHHPKLADQIKATYLRDMRKRAADMAQDLGQASTLLQHTDQRITQRHYRSKVTKIAPVR